MMGPGGILALGFAPGLFWLWRIYRKNRNRPDHKGLVLRTFLLGVAVALPIVVAAMVVSGPDHRPKNGAMDFATAAFEAFAVAGLVEEAGKFLVVRATMYRSPYFDEPMRGLIYSSAAALGFASIENVEYTIVGRPFTGITRAFLTTWAHVFFSALWGYALGAARRREDAQRGGSGLVALVGLVGGIGMHGGYDYALIRYGEEEGFPLALLIFLGGGVLFSSFSRLPRALRRRGGA